MNCGQVGDYRRDGPGKTDSGRVHPSCETSSQETDPSFSSRQVERVSSVTTDNVLFVSCRVTVPRLKPWSTPQLEYTLIKKELFGSVRSQDTQVRRPVQHVLGANNPPFEICGTAEVKIEVNGITAPHEVYVCGNLNQKILIGVDFLTSHGRVIDFVREAVESRVH